MGSAGPKILACLKTSVIGPPGSRRSAQPATARSGEQDQHGRARPGAHVHDGYPSKRGSISPKIVAPRRKASGNVAAAPAGRPCCHHAARCSSDRKKLSVCQSDVHALPRRSLRSPTQAMRSSPPTGPLGRHLEREGLAAVVTARTHRHRLFQERRDAERIDRAAGPALAAAGQDRDEIRRVFRRRDRPGARGLRTRRSDPVRPAPRRRRRCRARRCPPGPPWATKASRIARSVIRAGGPDRSSGRASGRRSSRPSGPRRT